MFEHRRELTLFAGPERLKPALVATHAAVMAVAVNRPPSQRLPLPHAHAARVARRRIRPVIARLGEHLSDPCTDSADASVFPLLPPCLLPLFHFPTTSSTEPTRRQSALAETSAHARIVTAPKHQSRKLARLRSHAVADASRRRRHRSYKVSAD